MYLKKFKENPLIISFQVYQAKDGRQDQFLGWVHYLKEEDRCRYAVSGPIGTHRKVQELVMSFIVERELLDIEL
jgi:hypothetical protein